MLRTSHGAPSPKKGEAPSRAAKPAAAPARAARTPSARTSPPSRRATAAATAAAAERAERAERSEDDGSRLKKAKPGTVPGATSTASDESREIAILIATKLIG